MHVIAVQGVAFIYLIARKNLGFGIRGSSLVAVLYAINPVTLYTIWQCWGGQIIAAALLLAIILLQSDSIIDGFSRDRSLACLPATVILSIGVLLTYDYMLAVTGVLLIGYFACNAAFGGRWRDAWRPGLYLAASLGICLVLNVPRISAWKSQLALVKDAPVGWFIPLLTPDVLMGANAARLLAGIDLTNSRAFWCVLAGLVFLAAGIRLARAPRSARDRIFFLGLTVPVLLIGLFFAYEGRNGDSWGGYRSFKMVSTFVGVILLGGAVPFLGWTWAKDRIGTVLTTIIVASILGIGVVNSWYMGTYATQCAFPPGPGLIALKKIESMPFVTGMNVLDADSFSLLWTNYFTLRTRQVYQRFPYGSRPVGALDQEFSLAKNREAMWATGYHGDILSVESSSPLARLEIGPWYTLSKVAGPQNIVVSPGEGWWDIESTHRWSGSNGKMCSIAIDAKTGGTPVRIEAVFLFPPGDANQILVKLNGRNLRTIQSARQLQTEIFQLDPGRSVIEFLASQMPGSPSARDPRTLGIAWRSVTIRTEPAGPHKPDSL